MKNLTDILGLILSDTKFCEESFRMGISDNILGKEPLAAWDCCTGVFLWR